MIDQATPNDLGAFELISNRPFTHTDYIQKDRKTLIHMGRQVCMVLDTYLDLLQKGKPVYKDEPGGRWHRFLIPRPDALQQAKHIYFVGFFGQKGENKSANYFSALDDRLIEQIPTFPEILCYSTMALTNGDFCNLVLLLDHKIKLKWREGDTHIQAVRLSPGYYRSIRINNGTISHGLRHYETLQIKKVKYFDYCENPPWKAVRNLA